jgi:hypothetical protein
VNSQENQHRTADFWHNLSGMLFRELTMLALPPQGRWWLFGLICCLQLSAHAQERAVVTFSFDFPGSEPDHYVVSVPFEGRASYDSNGKLSADSEAGDPFRLDFTVSEPTRSRIFDLTKRAHYFEGELDSKKKGLASTGTKTLIYKDAHKTSQATYNYSPIPAVLELTNLFQNLSTTLEFGRRLEYFHHYQKLALDEELKRMEQMSKENMLIEIPAIAPILQKIAADPSVINVVRLRAQRLLEAAGIPPR